MSYEIHKPAVDPRTTPEEQGPLMPPALDLDVERSVRVYAILAVAVGVVVAALVALYASRIQPIYSARTTVYVQPISTKVLGESAAFFDPAKYETYIQQSLLTAVRPDILASALAKLPPGTWQHPGESSDAAVARLAASLKVARVQSSYEINFTVAAPDQAAVAPVANAVTDAFLKLGRKDELAQTDERMQLLAEERDRISKELEAARAEQRDLGHAMGVANTSATGNNPYDQQLQQLRTQLVSAREAHEQAAAQLQAVIQPGPTGLEAAADEALAADPTLNTMKSTISQKQGQLVNQMAGLTPNNPVYKESEVELQQLNKQLESMTIQMREKAARRLQGKLRLDLAKTGDFEANLNGQLARLTAAATTGAPKLQRAEELAADITRLEARYATVDDAMRSLSIESSSPGLAHLSVAATPPTAPDSNRRNLFLILALPLGILAGVIAAVVANKQNPRLQVGKDVQKILGFQPMAVLPASADVSRDVIDEYVLRFAGGIDQALRRGRARSYLITAASTSVEIGSLIQALAERMEQLGFRTALVGTSVILQQPANGFEQGGITPARSSHASGSSSLDRRDEPRLMANIERLRKGHDLLLIAGEPILASAETEYVARLADVTILVAESGVTLRSELRQSAVLLKRVSAAGVAAVLTEVRLAWADRPFREAIQAMESRPYTSSAPGSNWDGGNHQRSFTEPDTPYEQRVPRWQEPEPEPATTAREADLPVTGAPPLVERRRRADTRPHAVAVVAEPASQPIVIQQAAPIEAPPTAAPAPQAAANPVLPLQQPTQPVAAPKPVLAVEPTPDLTTEPTAFAHYAAQLDASELLHPAPAINNPAKIVEERIAAARPAPERIPELIPELIPDRTPARPAERPMEPILQPIHSSFATPLAEAANADASLATLNDDSARRMAYLSERPELVDPADRHFNPPPVAVRPPHRNDFAPVAEEEKPHRSWVHRIFRRDAKAAYHIVPNDHDFDSRGFIADYQPVTPPVEHVADLPVVQPVPSPQPVVAAVDTPYIATNLPAVEAVEDDRHVEAVLHSAQPIASESPAPEDLRPRIAAPAVSLWEQAEREMFPPTRQQIAAPVVEPADDLQLQPADTTVLPEIDQPHSASSQQVAEPLVAPIMDAVETTVPQPLPAQTITEQAPEQHVIYIERNVAPEPIISSPVAPTAQSRPEEHISMPLVPMRADNLDPSFDFGNELAAWHPLPLSEPQPMYDSFIRPKASSGERREAYRAAAEPREIPTADQAADPAYQPIPEQVPVKRSPAAWAVAEELPIAQPQPEATATPAADTPEPREVRRFHLLHHFDRPITRTDTREAAEATQNGSR